MPPLLHLHPAPSTREDTPDFAPPATATAPWRPVRHAISDEHDFDPEGPIARQLRTQMAEGAQPVLLLTGRIADQLQASQQLHASLGPTALKTIHCIGCDDRPTLFHRPAVAHGLILDSEPLEIERENWVTHVGPGILDRVYVVPHRIPEPEDAPNPGQPALRHHHGLPDDEVVVSMVARRADPWLAAGMHGFATWSRGLYAECLRCQALSPDQFHPETARHAPRHACLYCGSSDINRPTPPQARLLVALLDPAESSPDPGVLAQWLGIGPSYTDASQWPWRDVHSVADISVALNDPAFTDPLVYAAMERSRTCVTNTPVDATPHVFRLESGSHSWDFRDHVTRYPSLSACVRALEKAARRAARGAAEAHPPPRRHAAEATSPATSSEASAVSATWQAALQALMDAPLTPRPSPRRRPMRPWRHGR